MQLAAGKSLCCCFGPGFFFTPNAPSFKLSSSIPLFRLRCLHSALSPSSMAQHSLLEENSDVISSDAPVQLLLLDHGSECDLSLRPSSHLRLDELDEDKDFRRRRPRRRLDVERERPRFPAKPGKRQNLPPKARNVILQLRSSSSELFLPTLRMCTSMNLERAEWLYVLRYFREQEDKRMLVQVYNVVLLEPAFRAGVRDYTNLIRTYIQLGDHTAVEETLVIMKERDVYPDLVTFTVVIAMYGRIGNFEMVKKTFAEMKLLGLVPDIFLYCSLVEAYSQLGYAEEAEQFIHEIEDAGLTLKIEIFISLIRGYGIIGQVKDAERLFQLMQLKLFYPERRSYSALMDAYTRDEDVEHAVEVFDNMISIGIEPTDRSLARLLIACEKKNMLGEATKIIEKLESKSFKFGTKTLISFKNWLEKLGLEREVRRLSKEISKRMYRKLVFEERFSDPFPQRTPVCD